LTLAGAARPPEINSVLMESTFRIHGPKVGVPNAISFGTTFLVGKPDPNEAGKAFYVLVTAAHVLDQIAGDQAILILRRRQADGSFAAYEFPVRIRDQGNILFVKHATADVAALYLRLPNDLDVQLIQLEWFASDSDLAKFEIHPGDELMCLGFPLAAASASGFPILRSGKIASYPITPTSLHNQILFDFQVFDGNSGGPVYFIDRGRTYGGTTHIGETIQFIAGLVTSQLRAVFFNNEALHVGAVVPSPYIRETIDLLPPAPK
jgi:hypothetical protein